MSAHTGYTFIKTRAILYILAFLLTAGAWVFVAIPWEMYRYWSSK